LRTAAPGPGCTFNVATTAVIDMSVKYYTHFLLHEPTPSPAREFRGVVELNSAVSCGDSKQAVAVLARTFECKSKDFTLLQWSRLQ
jgi:hypothetical protein